MSIKLCFTENTGPALDASCLRVTSCCCGHATCAAQAIILRRPVAHVRRLGATPQGARQMAPSRPAFPQLGSLASRRAAITT